MRLPSAFCLHDPFGWRTRKMLSANAYTSFVSDLVLAKPGTISKCLGKLLLFARLQTGRIVRGHVAIITKPSPHYVITESTISSCDVVLIPGLLPIFLHGCEIKSGWGLGTRLKRGVQGSWHPVQHIVLKCIGQLNVCRQMLCIVEDRPPNCVFF